VQQRRARLGQRDPRGVQQLACFAFGKAQVGRADLGQLAGQAELVQAQPHIVTRGQHRVRVRGKVRQQPGELSEGLGRGQLVQVIDNQRDAGASLGELRQHPAGHRLPIEVRCRRRRFRGAGRSRGVTDRGKQSQPELLGVVLAARHLQHGELARLPRTFGPGAQQRRLPAAGRSRDDRHPPRRRTIQGSDKIAPVDQPGNCWSHRHRPALISASDTSGPGHAVRAPSVSVPGQRACVNGARVRGAALKRLLD
jgi:hypothetical protein